MLAGVMQCHGTSVVRPHASWTPGGTVPTGARSTEQNVAQAFEPSRTARRTRSRRNTRAGLFSCLAGVGQAGAQRLPAPVSFWKSDHVGPFDLRPACNPDISALGLDPQVATIVAVESDI